jgi:alpha-ketoglutarate-dependent taurine dioxygenase
MNRPDLVEVHDGFVRITGDHALDFHLRWLRHNCDLDRHPITGEKTSESAELPDVLELDDAVLDDNVLRVTWSHDRRVSRFPLAWLREHAYATDRPAVPLPPSHVARLELVGDIEEIADRALAQLAKHGAALIRHESATPEAETEAWIAAFEARGLTTTPTHFGRIEDLRTDNTTNANTDQLGYTDAAIDLHTDQPFLDAPPRYQLLQSLRAAAHGGESLLADAKAAFEYLASIDRDASQRLLTTPVRFHRKQKHFEREVISPIITIIDRRFQIRSSYFTAAPYRLSFDEMESWYRAHDRFVRILRAHRYRFALRPGDTLIYDNHRMVHGRTAFSGSRWVRGVYFDADVDLSG